MFEKNKFQKYMFVNKYYKRTLVVLILANLQEFPKKIEIISPPPPAQNPSYTLCDHKHNRHVDNSYDD